LPVKATSIVKGASPHYGPRVSQRRFVANPHAASGGLDFDDFRRGRGMGDRLAVLLESLQMESYRLSDESERFRAGLCGSNATGKIRHVRPERHWTFFDDHQIAHPFSYFFSPACLSTLLSVPGGTSTFGLPATVMGLLE
jgi:hypothetical protein